MRCRLIFRTGRKRWRPPRSRRSVARRISGRSSVFCGKRVGAGAGGGVTAAGPAVADGADLPRTGGAVCAVHRAAVAADGGRAGGGGFSQCARGGKAGGPQHAETAVERAGVPVPGGIRAGVAGDSVPAGGGGAEGADGAHAGRVGGVVHPAGILGRSRVG